MMPAAKALDPVMGVDIHLIQPPGPVPPLPIPHPFIGMLFDPMDFVPMIGATVMVNGMPRAQAGTSAKNVPPHIPIGGMFVPPLPGNEGEMFMGSMTVLADGEPFSYLALPVLTCQSFGMPSIGRKKGGKKTSMMLPTSVVLPIPAGPMVLVGGPPMISMTAMAMKAGLAGLKKLKKTKFMKKLSDKLHGAANKIMDKLKIASEKVRNAVHKAICAVTGHPVDIATGKVFTEFTDFELPGPLPFEWERTWYSTSIYEGPLGHGWHHQHDLALCLDPENEAVGLRMADGRGVVFPMIKQGEEHFNRAEKLTLRRDERGYFLKNAKQLFYRFRAEKGKQYEVLPLISIENGAGHAIRFEHDFIGKLTQITDSGGRILTVEYDNDRRMKAIYAPHPERVGDRIALVQYRYDLNGNLSESIDETGHSMRYFYDGHLLVKETNRNGLNFHFRYDGTDHNAWCIRTWGDGGLYDHKLTYDKTNKLTVVENSLGHKTTYYWSDSGLVHQTVDVKGHIKTTTYSPDNEILAETDELGQRTAHSYDERGNRSSTMSPDGSKLQMTFDKSDQLVALVDEIGGQWAWKYDAQHQLISRADPLGRLTGFVFQNGNLTEVVDPLGNPTRLGYDVQHNLTSLTTPDGAESRWAYDMLGRCTRATDPNGNAQQRIFDFAGRVVRVFEADGNRRELKYDGEGNITQAVDNQHDVRFEYAGMNRLAARAEAGTRVEFKYDTEDQLVGIKNEHGFAYRFELDYRGEVAVEAGFDAVTRRYERDAAGRVVKVRRPGERFTEYEYDGTGRVLQVKQADGSVEKYDYRPDGELIEATNNHTRLLFERDPLGKILKETQGRHVVENEYDLLDRRISVKSSLGANLHFGRGLMGDVDSVSSKNEETTAWQAAFQRDNLGLETERLLPGGVKSRWSRDQLGRPVKQETYAAGGRATRVRTYKWDVNDRITEIMDSLRGPTKYGHDPLGNLAWAQNADGSYEYRMPDAVGNLFKKADRKDRKYGRAGQLLEADGARYEYDAEGNLTSKLEKNGGLWKYEWNAAAMLSRVTRPDGRVVSFTYDALGRRLSKTYQGRTTRWVWDGNVPLHEWAETGKTVGIKIGGVRETPAAGMSGLIRIKKRELEALAAAADVPETPDLEDLTTWVFEPETFAPLARLDADGRRQSIVTDHLGTPVAMFDEAGEQTWTMDLNIYGEVRRVAGWKNACPFRFPGQYEDEETGLYYNRFRYYDAEGGAYLSQDPIGLWGGKALYGYVHDSNIWFDPFGLSKTGYSKRKPSPGDKHFPNEAAARREAMRAHGVPTSQANNFERIDVHGQNPNLKGPNGEPSEILKAQNVHGQQVEIAHHSNGHVFEDNKTYEIAHYHGPNGEHYTYD